MKRFLILAFAATILLGGCAGVNNLDKYDLTDSKIFFDEIVRPEARNVHVEYRKADYSDADEKKSDVDVVKDIAVGVADIAFSQAAENKLIRAADPDSVVVAIAEGLEGALVKYLRIKPEYVLSDDSQFIVNTYLDELKLVSDPSDLFIRVRAVCEIVDRSGGDIVWRDAEAENISLRNTFATAAAGTISDIFFPGSGQTIDLAAVREEDLQNAIELAAESVGRLMAEKFRKDLHKAKSK